MGNHNGGRVPPSAKKPKPWKDRSGRPRSEAQLRETSKYWSKETWTNYLFSIDTWPTEFDRTDYDQLLEEQDMKLSLERFYEEEQTDEDAKRKKPTVEDVDDALAVLSERERQVIQSVFFEGRSQSETARITSLTRQRVSAICHDAIRKLRLAIEAKLKKKT